MSDLVIPLLILAIVFVTFATRTATRRVDALARDHLRASQLKPADVMQVIDGDTVIVQSDWNQITLRLDGIDCPEGDQPWGDAARAALVKLIGDQRIRFDDHGPDGRGQQLATIYIQPTRNSAWVNVNLRMVTLGHAWVAPGLLDRLPEDRCEDLVFGSHRAQRKRIGLWHLPDPVPPWQWRNMRGEMTAVCDASELQEAEGRLSA